MDGQTHVKQYVQDLKYKLCDKSCINCTSTHRNQNSLKKISSNGHNRHNNVDVISTIIRTRPWGLLTLKPQDHIKTVLVTI